MRLNHLFAQIVFIFNIYLRVHSRTQYFETADRSGFQLRILQQSDEGVSQQPSGVLDLSNATLDNVSKVNGISVQVNPNNSLIDDIQDQRLYSLIYNRVLIGEDSRVQVPDTLRLPYRSVGQIGNHCTGTVIGPRHVLTAAHCIVDQFTGNAFNDIAFTPAINGIIQPYKTFQVEDIFYPQEFLDQSLDFFQYDYGVIILKERFGREIVPLELDSPCDQTRNYVLNIIGYPDDKQQQVETPQCTDIPPPGGHTCAQQKNWGKCGQPWMQGYCDCTCQHSTNNGGCVDLTPPGGFSCAQQKQWGKCNEGWMSGYCACTCGNGQPKKYGTQWVTSCANVWINCQWNTFKHKCDTERGMSGSSMITTTGGNRYFIRGIHSAGTTKGEPYNQGVIITKQIQDQIYQLIQSTQ